MIFVVLGTQKFQFNRLLKKLDELSDAGKIEKIFAQIGQSDYRPQNYEYEVFLNKNRFERKMKECSMLITHGGVGTIISGIRYSKPILVVPRLQIYGEHIDDHQIQIAKAFSQKNYVSMCIDMEKLYESIQMAQHHTYNEYQSHRKEAVTFINNYLSKIEQKNFH